MFCSRFFEILTYQASIFKVSDYQKNINYFKGGQQIILEFEQIIEIFLLLPYVIIQKNGLK